MRGLLAGEQPQSKLTRLEADAGAAAGEAATPGVVCAPHSAVRGGGAGGDGGVATGRGRGVPKIRPTFFSYGPHDGFWLLSVWLLAIVRTAFSYRPYGF